MILTRMTFFQFCIVLSAALVISSTSAHASLPEPIDQTSIAPVKVSWFEGSENSHDESDPDTGRKSAMDNLAVKFSKYDVIFKNVFDNAHSALDGYQMKYKFNF